MANAIVAREILSGGINDVVLTRAQFYTRYDSLAKLEEDLSEKGVSLSESDAQELVVLANWVTKDRTTILKKEKIEVGPDKVFFVQFSKDRIKKINETLKRCLELKSEEQIVRAFNSEAKYRQQLQLHFSTDYSHELATLTNSHEVNKSAIQIFKNLEALEIDLLTAYIYPELKRIFEQVFNLYTEQKRVNTLRSELISREVDCFEEVFENRGAFATRLIQEEQSNILKRDGLGKEFKGKFEEVKRLTDEAFQHATFEMNRVAKTLPDKVLITSLHSTGEDTGRYLIDNGKVFETSNPILYNTLVQYIEKSLKQAKTTNEIINGCSHALVWKVERVERTALERVNMALAAISQSVQQMEMRWENRFEQESRPSRRVERLTVYDQTQDEEIYLENCLNRIFSLQARCIQNHLYNRKVDQYSAAERELLDQEVVRRGKGEMVFVQNSSTKNYLVCRANPLTEVEEKVHKRLPDTDLSLSPTHESGDQSIWHIERGIHPEGLMIQNIISKRYMVHIRDDSQQERKVVSNPLVHVTKKSSNENRRSIHENTYLYEGLWKFVKIDECISGTSNKFKKAHDKATLLA